MSMHKRKCCIVSCNVKSTDIGRKLFSFPKKNDQKYESWLEVCWESFEEINKYKQPKICDLHFEPRYIGKRKLYPHAIPSLKLNSKENATETETHFESENEDLSLEDLDTLDPFFKRKDSPSIEGVCNSCQKREKNIQYYRSKECNLLKENRRLKSLQKILRGENKKLKRKIQRLTKKSKEFKPCNIIEHIDSIDIEENPKIFCKMLLSSRQYTEKEKTLSCALFFKSSAVYKFMRNKLKFRLPSLSSVYSWLPIKSLAPGYNQELINAVKNSIMNFDDISKEVILKFDEVAIKRDLRYNRIRDKIDGFVDYGVGERSSQIAKSICVFMVSSVFGNWKQVLYYVVSENAINSQKLQTSLFKVLDVCLDLNLTVRALVCDQAQTNQKLYRSLGVKTETPFFERESQKIFCLFDVPHLFKSIRNNFLNYDLILPENKRASWKIIQELYFKERKSGTKICPKLSDKHIKPNRFERMSVKLAVQAISASTAAGIRTVCELGLFSEDIKDLALPTAECFEKLNNVFDCCNSKFKYSKNPYNCALQKNNVPSTYLSEMKDFIRSIKFDTSQKKVQIHCLKGLLQTIEAVQQLTDNYFSAYSKISYIRTNKLNQDDLENLFSVVRYKKRNPSVFEFNEIIGRIISVRLIFSSEFANCEQDNSEILQIDWEAVANPVMDEESSEKSSDCISESIDKQKIDVERDEESIEEENLEKNTKSVDPPTSDNATMYFAGYVLHQIFKRGGCEKCMSDTISSDKELTDPSQILLYYKNFSSNSDFGSLTAPSNYFFTVCKLQVKIFNEYFGKYPQSENILEVLLARCISQIAFWYDKSDSCYDHRIKILRFFLLVLIRKNCMEDQ